MTLETIRELLGWSCVVNYAALTLWLVFFIRADKQIYQLHKRWFSISKQQFDAIHYGGMAFYKMAIFFLNLTPYIAIRIIL